LLENLRFHAQEKKGDQDFARSLAELADIYVNDAFGTAHRKHASTALINQFLPSALGFLIEKEIVYLSKALKPEKPYMVILGGAKVSDKIDVVKNLIQKADKIIIGGAMAYTFLKSKGENVGSSLVEEDKLDLASTILQEAKTKGTEILLPVDHLAVKDIEQPETRDVFDQIPEGFKGVDIGPKTIEFFRDTLKQAKTVLWNGPLGIFEKQEYSKGTAAIAASLADLEGATVIVGGGDSASAAKQFKVAEKLDHVSTGGGASLTFLEGKELPALAAIADKE
jgi:phosphoglycerate kinase/triosephosphate isomerase